MIREKDERLVPASNDALFPRCSCCCRPWCHLWEEDSQRGLRCATQLLPEREGGRGNNLSSKNCSNIWTFYTVSETGKLEIDILLELNVHIRQFIYRSNSNGLLIDICYYIPQCPKSFCLHWKCIYKIWRRSLEKFNDFPLLALQSMHWFVQSVTTELRSFS